MPINKITAPSEVPASVDDYAAQNNLLEALLLSVQGAQRIVGSNVAKGAVFLVGGATYLADADTAISGSASDYVKLTPSVDGLTLAPSYVADLTGVAWNSTYNGYYDASGNLYVFDELKALSLGTITTAKLRDIGLKNLAAGWATALITALGSGWLTALGAAANTQTTQGLNLAAGAAGTNGTWAINAGNSSLIPAGLYMVAGVTGMVLQIYATSSWETASNAGPINGLMLSDGANFRIYNSAASPGSVYYRKIL